LNLHCEIFIDNQTKNSLYYNMKICVYTIAKNEEANVKRWADSCQDADYRVVCDTGSQDNTVVALQQQGVTVYNIQQTPWRFDHARNQALNLCPQDADICISLDMDEWLMPGWRQAVEQAWTPGTTRLSYMYVFAADVSDQGFWANKIHARQGYTWRRAVHESVFACGITEQERVCQANLILQTQDRSQPHRRDYLELMALAHEEDPEDSQLAFWYARECVHHGEHVRAQQALAEFLSISNSWWAERNEALRLSAALHENPETWLLHAVAEGSRRETWQDLAKLYYSRQDWHQCSWASHQGLIAAKTLTYLDSVPDDHVEFHDLLAISYWNLGWHQQAQVHAQRACEIEPGDTRLQANLAIINQSCK
jgi:glycosyltransferase involved in cell wall biosynthesis